MKISDQKSNTFSKAHNKDTFLSKIGMYIFIGGATVSIIGGIYYLYSLFSKQEELTEEQLIEIEEIRQRIEENNGEICTDLAIRILAQINKRVEEIIRTSKPDIDNKRREALGKESVYNSTCAEYFTIKENSYNKATNEILSYFNMQISDLKEIMEQITPNEVEKKMFHYNKPTFYDSHIPDKSKVKEAFIFFGNLFVDEMLAFNSQISKLKEISHDLTLFKMLVVKMKVDDILYEKFKLTENQIRYLIFEYSLLEDKEVKVINERISKYEEMLYLQ